MDVEPAHPYTTTRAMTNPQNTPSGQNRPREPGDEAEAEGVADMTTIVALPAVPHMRMRTQHAVHTRTPPQRELTAGGPAVIGREATCA
jgi:hypothetical protein